MGRDLGKEKREDLRGGKALIRGKGGKGGKDLNRERGEKILGRKRGKTLEGKDLRGERGQRISTGKGGKRS